jgi:hypothetical protein
MKPTELVLLKETTEWSEGDYVVPNHYYLTTASRDHLVGYISEDFSQVQAFAKPIKFSTKKRTFTPVAF